mmetsp:Transcript_40212/g.72224  ORF Transcript_40212/g.72224 Transcript_40212/m.72224 type:complete len:328 (-) Transcript_40212:84-1067(-)
MSSSAAANHAVLLEQYIESTTHMPPELQRLLGTIRDLDDRTDSISADVSKDVARCLTLVPQSSWKGQGEQYREVAELRRRIEDQQRMLVQIGEEKVQLAIQGYALVDKQLGIISQHVKEQEEEEGTGVSVEAQQGEGALMGLVSPSASHMNSQQIPKQANRPPLSATPRQANKQYDGKLSGEKRARDRERDMEQRLDREVAASAADMNGKLAGPAAMKMSRKGSASQVSPSSEYVVPEAIRMLQPSAPTPQAQGRLLTHADISQELKGRHAELFWPDDNLWYVITIHTINPMAKTADIMYTTGETELLDLNEIVRDGHMSLIHKVQV